MVKMPAGSYLKEAEPQVNVAHAEFRRAFITSSLRQLPVLIVG